MCDKVGLPKYDKGGVTIIQFSVHSVQCKVLSEPCAVFKVNLDCKVFSLGCKLNSVIWQCVILIWFIIFFGNACDRRSLCEGWSN